MAKRNRRALFNRKRGRVLRSRHLATSRRDVRLAFEPLEPRLLLSASNRDLLSLPGLRLVDGAANRLHDQLVYLDFNGAQDVSYHGPVHLEGVTVPAFEAPDTLADQESVIIGVVLDTLNRDFAGSGVNFTTELPGAGTAYSTIYVGGDDSAFSAYGSFHGLAEKVDVGNVDRMDEGFVFSDELSSNFATVESFAGSLAANIAHETGHMLGYAHADSEPDGGSLLGPVASIQHQLTGVPNWVPQGPSPINTSAVLRPLSRTEQTGAIQDLVLQRRPDLDTPDTGDSTVYAFAGTVGGGVWRTKNVESSSPDWRPLTDALGSLSVSSLALVSESGGGATHLFVGTGSFSSAGDFRVPGTEVGIYRTRDPFNPAADKISWEKLGSGVFDVPGQELAIRRIIPSDPTKLTTSIFVAADDGNRGGVQSFLYQYTGGRFIPISRVGKGSLPAGRVTDIVADRGNATKNINNQVLYVAIPGQGIYQTNDSGATWFSIANVLPLANGVMDAAATITNATNVRLAAQATALFVGVVGPGGRLSGIFRSPIQPGNQLGNWTNLGPPPLAGIHPGGQGQTHFSIVADPDADILYVGGDDNPDGADSNLYRVRLVTEPTPAIWKWESLTSDTNAPHPDSRNLVFLSQDEREVMYDVDDGGIYRVTDPQGDNPGVGTNWTSLNGNLNIAELYSAAYVTGSRTASENDNIFAGAQDNGTSAQTGAGNLAWNLLYRGDGFVSQYDALGNVLYSFQNNFGSFFQHRIATPTAANSSQIRLLKPGSAIPATVAGFFSGLNVRDLPLSKGSSPEYIPFATNAVKPNRMLIGLNGLYEDNDPQSRNGVIDADRDGLIDVFAGDFISELTRVPPTPPGAKDPPPVTLSDISLIGTISALVYGGTHPDSGPNADVALVGTNGNATNDGQLLYRSGARGNFTNATALFPRESFGALKDIVIDPNDWRKVYVIRGNQVLMTPNIVGQPFGDITGNLDELTTDLRSITLSDIDPITGQRIVIVGGLGGVFRRLPFANLPSGGVWSEFGRGLPNTIVSDVDYVAGADPDNTLANGTGVLLAATMGRGAWTIPNVTNWLTQTGLLTITGTKANERVKLTRNAAAPSLLEVRDVTLMTNPQGILLEQFELSNIEQISVALDALSATHDDELIIDATNGVIFVESGITFTGVQNTFKNKLTLQGNATVIAHIPTSGTNPNGLIWAGEALVKPAAESAAAFAARQKERGGFQIVTYNQNVAFPTLPTTPIPIPFPIWSDGKKPLSRLPAFPTVYDTLTPSIYAIPDTFYRVFDHFVVTINVQLVDAKGDPKSPQVFRFPTLTNGRTTDKLATESYRVWITATNSAGVTFTSSLMTDPSTFGYFQIPAGTTGSINLTPSDLRSQIESLAAVGRSGNEVFAGTGAVSLSGGGSGAVRITGQADSGASLGNISELFPIDIAGVTGQLDFQEIFRALSRRLVAAPQIVASTAPSSVKLSTDAWFVIAGEGIEPVAVVVPALITADNTTIDHLVDDLNTAMNTAGLTGLLQAESTSGGHLVVRGSESGALLSLTMTTLLLRTNLSGPSFGQLSAPLKPLKLQIKREVPGNSGSTETETYDVEIETDAPASGAAAVPFTDDNINMSDLAADLNLGFVRSNLFDVIALVDAGLDGLSDTNDDHIILVSTASEVLEITILNGTGASLGFTSTVHATSQPSPLGFVAVRGVGEPKFDSVFSLMPLIEEELRAFSDVPLPNDFVVDPSYDPVSNSLLFNFELTKIATIPVQLDFFDGIDLGAILGKLEVAALVDTELTVQVDFDFRVGLHLGDLPAAFPIQPTTTLSALNGGEGVELLVGMQSSTPPPANGKFTSDASFTLAFQNAGVQGGPISVVMPELDTRDNTRPSMLVADLNRAFAHTPFDANRDLDEVVVAELFESTDRNGVISHAIVLRAVDPSIRKITIAGGEELGFQGTVQSNFADIDFVLSTGRTFSVNLDGAVTVQDAIDRIHEASKVNGTPTVDVTINTAKNGLIVRDVQWMNAMPLFMIMPATIPLKQIEKFNPQSGTYEFNALESVVSRAGNGLGILGTSQDTNLDNSPDGVADVDELLEGGPLHGLDITDRIFIVEQAANHKDVTITAKLVTDVDVSGALDEIGLDLQSAPNDPLAFSITAAIHLTDLDNDNRIYISDFTPENILTIVGNTTFAPAGSGTLELAANVFDENDRFDLAAMLGETDPVFSLSFGFDTVTNKFSFTPSANFQALFDQLKDFGIEDFVQILERLVDELKNNPDLPFLNKKIPLINKSVGDALKLADSLLNAADRLISHVDFDKVEAAREDLETAVNNLGLSVDERQVLFDQLDVLRRVATEPDPDQLVDVFDEPTDFMDRLPARLLSAVAQLGKLIHRRVPTDSEGYADLIDAYKQLVVQVPAVNSIEQRLANVIEDALNEVLDPPEDSPINVTVNLGYADFDGITTEGNREDRLLAFGITIEAAELISETYVPSFPTSTEVGPIRLNLDADLQVVIGGSISLGMAIDPDATTGKRLYLIVNPPVDDADDLIKTGLNLHIGLDGQGSGTVGFGSFDVLEVDGEFTLLEATREVKLKTDFINDRVVLADTPYYFKRPENAMDVDAFEDDGRFMVVVVRRLDASSGDWTDDILSFNDGDYVLEPNVNVPTLPPTLHIVSSDIALSVATQVTIEYQTFTQPGPWTEERATATSVSGHAAKLEIGLQPKLGSVPNALGAVAFPSLGEDFGVDAALDIDGMLIASLDAELFGNKQQNIVTLATSLHHPLNPQITFDSNALKNLFKLDFDLRTIVEGLDKLLVVLDELVRERISNELPLASGGMEADQNVFGKLRKKFTLPLLDLLDKTGGSLEDVRLKVQQFVFDTLGPAGLSILADRDDSDNIVDLDDVGVTLTEEKFEIQIRLAGRDETVVDFNSGLDALPLKGDGGVKLGWGYEIDFGVGIARDEGFYFILNSSDLDPELSLDIGAGLIVDQSGPEPQSTSLTLDLFGLKLSATDVLPKGSNGNPTGEPGTKAGGELTLNLKDPLNDGDNHLTLEDIVTHPFKEVFDVGMVASANVNLRLAAGINDNLPSVQTDLIVNWSATFNNETSTFDADPPTIKFVNLGINLGDFLSKHIGNVVDDVNRFIEPIKPVIKLLTTRVPGVSELSVAAGRGPVDFLDLAFISNPEEGKKARKFVDTVAGIIDLIESLDAAHGENLFVVLLPQVEILNSAMGSQQLVLPRGSGANGLEEPFVFFANGLVQTSSRADSNITGVTGVLNSLLKQLHDIGMTLDFIETPTNIVNMLMGKPFDVISWDIPEFRLPFTWEAEFPVIPVPPIDVRIGLDAEIFADLSVGYDSHGLATGNFFDGFYFGDRKEVFAGEDIDEFGVSLGVRLAALLDLVIVKAGIEGEITADIFANWRDLDSDGKIHLDEIEQIIDQDGIECLFDLHGEVRAIVRAVWEFTPTHKTGSKEFINELLFSFTHECPTYELGHVSQNGDSPLPGITTDFADFNDAGTLVLHAGAFASMRRNRSTSDVAEAFEVEELAPGVYEVRALGLENRYSGVNRIYFDGGNRDDRLTLINVTVPVAAFGGAGNDVLYGGPEVDLLDGGIGNDEIYGGDAGDSIFAGAGEDIVYGQLGGDLIYGGAGADLIYGDGGLTDGPQSTDGGDTIYGEAGNDRIFGFGGVDIIDGGSGSDFLLGGDDNDKLSGGSGADLVSGGLGADTLDGDSGNDVVLGGLATGHADVEGILTTMFGFLTTNFQGNDSWLDQIRIKESTTGVDAADIMFGGVDNDMLIGDTGPDIMYGGWGDDVILAYRTKNMNDPAPGVHHIEGGPGDDFICATESVDHVYGGTTDLIVAGNVTGLTGLTHILCTNPGPGYGSLSGGFDLISCDEAPTFDVPEPVTISGQKFEDRNGNGVRDAGEPALNGFVIELYDLEGELIATAETADVDRNADKKIDPTTETGTYVFKGLDPGRYQVREAAAPGYIQTTPTSSYDVVLDTESAIGLNFGNQGFGEVQGVKWLDLDGDGIRRKSEPGIVGEPGIAGVVIYADLDSDGVLDTDEPSTTTMSDDSQTSDDETGRYRLTDLPVGSYSIREVRQSGSIQTYPDPSSFYSNNFNGSVGSEWSNSSTVTSPGTETVYQGDIIQQVPRQYLGGFGNDTVTLQLAALPVHSDVRITADLILVGGWDSSGTGAADEMRWTLRNPLGNSTNVVVVDATFANPTGSPSLLQSFPARLGDGLNPAGTGALMVKSLGYTSDSVYRISFTVPHTSDRLTLDLEALGLDSATGDSWGLDNVNVTIIGEGQSVTVVAGSVIEDVDFGNKPVTSEIRGQKWLDIVGNGQRDLPADVGLDNWVIQLFDEVPSPMATAVQTVTTAPADLNQDGTIDPITERGRYRFTELLPGTYYVSETLVQGHTQTYPGLTPKYYTVTLEGGELMRGFDFGNAPPGEVHGMKWNDLDGDGIHDTGELGIAGVTIYADLNNNSKLDLDEPRAVTMAQSPTRLTGDADGDGTVGFADYQIWVNNVGRTNATPADGDFDLDGIVDSADFVIWRRNYGNSLDVRSGEYWLENVPAGQVLIREVVPAGRQQTYPTQGCHVVEVSAGQSIEGIDFGNRVLEDPQPAAIRGPKVYDENKNDLIEKVEAHGDSTPLSNIELLSRSFKVNAAAPDMFFGNAFFAQSGHPHYFFGIDPSVAGHIPIDPTTEPFVIGLSEASDGTVYGVNQNGQIGIVDVHTGDFSVVGNLPMTLREGDIAFRPGGNLWITSSSGTNAGFLLEVDLNGAAPTVVSTIAIPTSLSDVGFSGMVFKDANTIYLYEPEKPRLVITDLNFSDPQIIDFSTGTLGTRAGIDFDSQGNLWIVNKPFNPNPSTFLYRLDDSISPWQLVPHGPGSSVYEWSSLVIVGQQSTPGNPEIHGIKWSDLNGNGVHDVDEPGLADVTIYVDLNRNGQLDFGLLPGDYNDDHVVDAGDYVVWRAHLGMAITLPNEGVGVTPGMVTREDYDVWRANFGATANPPEPYAITVGDDPTTASIDETGRYWIMDVPVGTHPVREIVPNGFTQTYPSPLPPPAGTSGAHQVTVTAGQVINDINFGNKPLLSSIHGQKWEDKNANGVRDFGESGLGGWEIELFNAEGDIIATTTTTAQGIFSFDNLLPGSYQVGEVLQNGWKQSLPSLDLLLEAGDANKDGNYDERDVMQVLEHNRFGLTATWEQGDWNRDGVFNEDDWNAADATGNYNSGPYLDENARRHTVTLAAGAIIHGVDFANFETIPLPDGDDVIHGGDGDDFLYGDNLVADPRIINLGTRRDTIEGEAGRDSIFGQDEDDILWGANEELGIVSGNDDKDYLVGGTGSDEVRQTVDDHNVNIVNIQKLTNNLLSGQSSDPLSGDDLLSIEHATLTGGADCDILDAGDFTLGWVRLEGLAGNDDLYGGSKGDALFAGSGANFLSGGAGDDVYWIAPAATVSENDEIEEFALGGVDTLNFSLLMSGVTVDLSTTALQIANDSGANVRTVSVGMVGQQGELENIVGTSSDDTITGNDVDNVILSLGGSDDILDAGDGADTIDLGEGLLMETAEGGQGADTYLLASNSTFALTDDGGDDIYKFSLNWGTGTIVDDGGDDTVDFSALTDALKFTIGSFDVTYKTNSINAPTGGLEHLIGGQHDDVFVFRNGAALPAGGSIDAQGGEDLLDYSAYAIGIDANLSNANWPFHFIAANSATGVDSVINVEDVTGGGGADTVIGDDTRNILRGGFGADTIVGLGGNDELYGDADNDDMVGGSGEDLLVGGSGYDTLDGQDDGDTYQLDDNAGSDTVTDTGGAGTDVLDFSLVTDVLDLVIDIAASPTIAYGNGEHLIGTNNAFESLIGGEGDDTFRFQGNAMLPGSSSIDGRGGTNALDYSLYNAISQVRVNLSDQTFLSILGQSATGVGAVTNVDNIIGSNFADVIVGNTDDNYLVGRGGDDTIYGRRGDDRLEGGQGVNDHLYGDQGDDWYVVTLQSGNFTLTLHEDGGTAGMGLASAGGNDTIDLSKLQTTIEFNLNNSSHTLGPLQKIEFQTNSVPLVPASENFENVIGSSTSPNKLTGNSKANILVGGSDEDVLVGGDGDDVLVGLDADDSLEGEAGNDVLLGGSGLDGFGYPNATRPFSGGAGRDILVGGEGTDQLFGKDTNEDILIAGYTAYEDVAPGTADLVVWQQILAKWTSPLSPVARRAIITSGVGFDEQGERIRLELGTTVSNDMVADTLFYDADTDWLFFHDDDQGNDDDIITSQLLGQGSSYQANGNQAAEVDRAFTAIGSDQPTTAGLGDSQSATSRHMKPAGGNFHSHSRTIPARRFALRSHVAGSHTNNEALLGSKSALAASNGQTGDNQDDWSQDEPRRHHTRRIPHGLAEDHENQDGVTTLDAVFEWLGVE